MPKIIKDLEKRLTEEARRQIEEDGYGAMTVRSVAKACGVGVGTVYNYFSSKDELLAGYLLAGFDARASLTRTVSFIAECIEKTETALPEHWYGVKFEDSLYRITEDIRKKQWEDALLGH